jgi:hypothetical protein
MNEVVCTAQEIDAKLFYTDTDSLHMSENDVDRLSDRYREIYCRELIGKGLGCFHSDFNCEELSADTNATGQIYSEKFIALGKKCYVDVLRRDGTEQRQYHIRMKGVPSKSILVASFDAEITPD